MNIIKTQTNCKVCITREGASALTRLKQYFGHKNDFYIMSNSIMSIQGLFDDPDVHHLFKDCHLKFILDDSFDQDDKLISYMKRYYHNFEFKFLKNVNLSIFISATNGVDFECYPFGYKPNVSSTPSAFALKIKNTKMAVLFREWFEKCWSNNEILPFDDILLESKQDATFEFVDDGGILYKNIKAKISFEKEIKNDYVEKIIFQNIIVDNDFYFTKTSAVIYSFDDYIQFAYHIADDIILSIILYDNVVRNGINTNFINEVGEIEKKVIDINFDTFMNYKKIYGSLFYVMIKYFFDNVKMAAIKKHYYEVRGKNDDTDRKYNDAFRSAKNYYDGVYNEAASPNDIYVGEQKQLKF